MGLVVCSFSGARTELEWIVDVTVQIMATRRRRERGYRGQ